MEYRVGLDHVRRFGDAPMVKEAAAKYAVEKKITARLRDDELMPPRDASRRQSRRKT
jgi:hypothetical protein